MGRDIGHIRFLLVDDHLHAQSVLHRLISILPGGEVVDEAGNGEEYLLACGCSITGTA